MASPTSRTAAAKAACALLCAAAIAAALLSLRQQRLLAAREMLTLHEEASQRRLATQRLRAEIARLLDPENLEPRARRALPLAALEPIQPLRDVPATALATADPSPVEPPR